MRPDPAAVTAGLSELIGAPVTITGAASVGAQRSTLFVDIERDDGVEAAVAQISGTVIESRPATGEADLIRLASAVGVPVPTVYAVTDDLAGVGAPAMVVSKAEGRTIPRHILRHLSDDEAGDRLANQCGAALARLHTIRRNEIPDHVATALSEHFVDLQEERLDLLPAPHPAIRYGIRWLRENPITDPDPTLVHGDFRNGNIVVDDAGLVAVLDWEVAQASDPMQDLAWLCLRTWRFGSDHRPVGGFGALDALVGGYEAAGGTFRHDAFHWWSVARSVWWAIGLAGQSAAFTRGLTDSIVLAASGRRVSELEYDLLTLIAGDHGPRPDLQHGNGS